MDHHGLFVRQIHQWLVVVGLDVYKRQKVVSAREAVSLIRAGDTVATSGFVGTGFAEDIACALEELYLAPEDDPNAPGLDRPRDLTLVYAAGQGDGKQRGLCLLYTSRCV